jgi:chemotaxis protein histidine kinase CheA
VDQIKEMLNQLSELADDQVVELQSQIIGEFEAVENEDPSPQTVDAMTSLADMLDTVRTELKQREAAAQELAQRAAEAAARVRGEDGMEQDEESEMVGEEITEPIVEPTSEEMDEEMAMDEEMKEDVPVDLPMEEEPAPSDEEVPVVVEDDEDEAEKAMMSKLSTDEEKTIELSTDESPEPEAPAEDAVTASAEEDESSEVEAAEEEETDSSDSDEESAEAEEDEGEAVASVESESTEEASVESQETPTEPSAQETMEAPVTAAANADNLDIEVPADRRPVAQVSAAPVAITAGADIPGYTAGSSLESMDAVAEAMAKRIHSLRRVNGGDGEQHIVASITTQYPEERTLSTDPEENWAKIQNVVGPEALVAAGGHQAPFEVRYDIFGFGTTNRPVRDALPKFQADRGGIRYILPPVLENYADAVGVWTAANDAATTPDPAAKASLTVAAATETTVATDAVTLQMQFGNLVTRAYPELVARHNELGLIQHAREAEQYLLSKIAAGSTAVTTSSLIGFGRDFLVQVGRAATAYRSRHRLESDAPLRMIIPSWVKDAMAADLALSMPGDSTLNAYSEIDGYLSARGVVVSYSLDQNVYGAQGVGALVEFTDSFTWYLFYEGTFLFLDGGTLDLGIIRDSGLVGTNDYKMFVETFEGVAKVGIESLAITSTINVNGAAAALRDTLGGVASAVIEY